MNLTSIANQEIIYNNLVNLFMYFSARLGLQRAVDYTFKYVHIRITPATSVRSFTNRKDPDREERNKIKPEVFN